MNRKFTIGVDVDGVVANLLPAWVGRYNDEWNDTLDYQRIDEWDMIPFVKPECAKLIYRYIADPSLYDEVKPIYYSREGVKELRRLGHRVVFVTATPVGCNGRKFQWLREWGFEPTLKDYIEAEDKSLIATDFLVDDRDLNVTIARGEGLIFDAPYNRNLFGHPRFFNWKEVVDWFINLERK